MFGSLENQRQFALLDAAFHWRRDAFGRPIVHIADVTRRPLIIRDREIRQNRRYVLSVHGNPVMLDSAEDATTGRCADCLAWLAKQAKR